MYNLLAFCGWKLMYPGYEKSYIAEKFDKNIYLHIVFFFVFELQDF